MIKNPTALWLMVGVMGLFSIGYYVLPVFSKQSSGLASVNKNLITEVILMSILFFASIIAGVFIGLNSLKQVKTKKLLLDRIDKIFIKNYKLFFFLSLIGWLIYFFTSDLTSYSSDDFEAFFFERNIYTGLLSSLSNLGLSIMAVSIAISIKLKDPIRYIMVTFYFLTIALLIVSAQRLAVITPIFMLIAALSVYGNYKIGIKAISVGLVLLVLISPLIVFLREYEGTRGKEKIFEAASDYNSTNIIDQGYISIMERADLLLVMTSLKSYYDKNPYTFNEELYIYSVFYSFIPKFIYADKPYALSDDGTIFGEISVQAWLLMKGNSTGSLSAFGSISAYREGGSLWVLINGLLTGILLFAIYFFLTKGGHIAKILFVSLFVTICIKNVPPSFFYLIVFIVPTIQLIIIFYTINYILRK